MKKILSKIEGKYSSEKKDEPRNHSKKRTNSSGSNHVNKSQDDELDDLVNNHKKFNQGAHNKLSIEAINFLDEEKYSLYPDDSFQPSVYFWKFLVVRPEFEKENKKKYKKLNLFIPDTLVFNESDVNFWIYTDINGKVCRTDYFTDSDVLEKFKSVSFDSQKEVLAVFKTPTYSGNLLEGNIIEVLNIEELEKHLFSKSSNPSIIQKFVKCRGPKAFMCRSVYKKNKPPFVYIFTNKAGYSEVVLNQSLKFIINSENQSSYYTFYATSGKHLEETNYYMNNIVKFIEINTDIIFEELACDFIKDEAGTWWMINCKAMKIKNISKFKDELKTQISQPMLSKFITRNSRYDGGNEKKKFDYQTKLKCKFCGISYNKVNLKYNLTTKMILETNKQLKHLNINLNYIDRPDLSHTDSSMVYLNYRVCEDCYLMFETMNDIKKFQIKIANFFRIGVDSVNFGVDYFVKDTSRMNIGVNTNLQNKFSSLLNIPEEKLSESIENINLLQELNRKSSTLLNKTQETIVVQSDQPKIKKENNLYRIIIIFSDIFWNPEVPIPDKELYLVFNFLGNHYKAKIKDYYPELDYLNVNFFKMFYVACDPIDGFIEYIDKNRTMKVRLGFFKVEEDEDQIKEQNKIQEQKINNNNIVIEDKDICSENELKNFVQFSDVELSIQGLKYGEKYRNSLNGLLFKEHKPYYTGKLRCTIRINKEKPIDISKFNFKKLLNLYLPPIHFVTPEELPDYWLEIIERQKLRESILNKIMTVMTKENIPFEKSKNKEQIFMALESLVSNYLSKNKK